jgi:hypothetical protein
MTIQESLFLLLPIQCGNILSAMGNSKRAGGPQWRVGDPTALAGLVQRVIGSPRFGGNLSEAARTIGMPQSTLDRIARGNAEQIRTANLRRLGRLWDGDVPVDVQLALVSPQQRENARAYSDWVEGELRRCGRAPRTDVQALLDRAAALVPELREIPAGLRNTEGKRRAHIRMLRALAGLLDHKASGGVERDWRELSDIELARYIRGGLAREDILLRRQPDANRLSTPE